MPVAIVTPFTHKRRAQMRRSLLLLGMTIQGLVGLSRGIAGEYTLRFAETWNLELRTLNSKRSPRKHRSPSRLAREFSVACRHGDSLRLHDRPADWLTPISSRCRGPGRGLGRRRPRSLEPD